jgi:hypothetical protein
VPDADGPDLLTRAEAIELAGVTGQTMRGWLAHRLLLPAAIESIGPGRTRHLFAPADVMRAKAAHAAEAAQRLRRRRGAVWGQGTPDGRGD